MAVAAVVLVAVAVVVVLVAVAVAVGIVAVVAVEKAFGQETDADIHGESIASARTAVVVANYFGLDHDDDVGLDAGHVVARRDEERKAWHWS